MHDWLEQKLGIAHWMIDSVFAPLLVIAFVFLVRELVLAAYRRRVDDRERRKVWRRRTFWAAVPTAILLAVGEAELMDRTRIPGESAVVDTAGALTRGTAYTALLITLWLLIGRVSRNLSARLDDWKHAEEGVKVRGAVLLSPVRVRGMLQATLRAAAILVRLFLVYLYVPLILSAIPWTHDLANDVMPFLMAPIMAAGRVILDYLPNLITLIVIVIVGRYVLRMLRFSMAAIGSGALKLEGFEAEWAEPTYKLGRLLIVLILIMISYPYMPGSGSDVFKGFSVFVGALVTLGASSSIANVIAGIILTYTGSFRVGDRVAINEIVGDVIEKKLFVTRLRTIYNEEVTIPNQLIMQKQVVNYTTSSQKGGLALTVEAGIGYDVDWRTVHELMKKAAAETEKVVDEPEPLVLQHGLGDFAVQYKLVAFTDDAKAVVKTVSELRPRALDAFNEAGVEIMTPMVHAIRNQSGLTTPNRSSEDVGAFRLASVSQPQD